MAIPSLIQGADGSVVDVQDNQLLTKGVVGLPAVGSTVEVVPYRSYFLNAGSSAMTVDGSTTAVEFTIEADATADLYITSMLFEIGEGGAQINEFGNIPALANGVDVEYNNGTAVDLTGNMPLRTAFDVIKFCVNPGAFGSGSNVYRVTNADGVSEVYAPSIDLKAAYGLDHGLVLRANTTDKLVIRINDDLLTPALDFFTVQAQGFKRLP